MSENLEPTANDLNADPVTPEDIAEVIAEFEQYRSRLIEDMTTAAKKAKLSKSKLMTRLEPELANIDATLENLRNQYAMMIANN
jgi:molecular chaperone GrpE (heat shock protein)